MPPTGILPASIYSIGLSHKLNPADIEGGLRMRRRLDGLFHLFGAVGLDIYLAGPVRKHATDGKPTGTVGETTLVAVQIHPPAIACKP